MTKGMYFHLLLFERVASNLYTALAPLIPSAWMLAGCAGRHGDHAAHCAP